MMLDTISFRIDDLLLPYDISTSCDITGRGHYGPVFLTDQDIMEAIIGDIVQGCGNTMPDLVPFHSGQVDNFNLLVLGQVQNLYKVNKNIYYIPITDTTLKLSVFWPSDTESQVF